MSLEVPDTFRAADQANFYHWLFPEDRGRTRIRYQSIIDEFVNGGQFAPMLKTVLLAKQNKAFIEQNPFLKVVVLVALQKEKIQDDQSLQLKKLISQPLLEEAALYFQDRSFSVKSEDQEWHQAFKAIVDGTHSSDEQFIYRLVERGDPWLADLLFRDNDVRIDERFLGGDNILAYALRKKQYGIALSILRRNDAHTLIFPKLGERPLHLIKHLDPSNADEGAVIKKVRRAAWDASRRIACRSSMRRKKALAKAHAQYKNISSSDLDALRKKGWNHASKVSIPSKELTPRHRECIDAAHRFTREAHKQGTFFFTNAMKGSVAILVDLLSHMERRKKARLRIEDGAKVFPNAAVFLDNMDKDFRDNHFSHSFLSTSRLFNTNEAESALYFFAHNYNIDPNVNEMGQEMICRFIENEDLRGFFVEEYSKIQKEFQFSRLNILTIPETTLRNEKTNYVYAAFNFGKKCSEPLKKGETRQENFARILGAHCETPNNPYAEAPNRQHRILVGNFEQDPEAETFPFDTLTAEQQSLYEARMNTLTKYMRLARGLEKLSKTTSAKKALSLLKAFFELKFSSAHQGIKQGLVDLIKKKSDILGQILRSSKDASQLTGKQWEEYLQMLSPQNETEKKRGSYPEIGLAIALVLAVASFGLSLIHQITLGAHLRDGLRYGGICLPIIATIVYHIYSKKSAQFISDSRISSPPLPKLKKIPDSYFHLTGNLPEDMLNDANGNAVLYHTDHRTYPQILALTLSDPKTAREGSMNQGWLTSRNEALHNSPDAELTRARGFIKESRTELYKSIRTAFPQVDLPPPLRPVWADCQDTAGNTTQAGNVVGYHPLLLLNFKYMRSILVNTIERVRKELIDSGKLKEEDLDSGDANALKLLRRFTVIKMLEESSYNPHEKGKLRSENPVAPFFPIDHDTFDMQECHGRDVREAINEPYLTKTMMDALTEEEYAAFNERAYDTSDKPEKNQRVSFLIQLVDEIGDAIQKRYVTAGQGRQALPKRLDSKPILDAIAGPILG